MGLRSLRRRTVCTPSTWGEYPDRMRPCTLYYQDHAMFWYDEELRCRCRRPLSNFSAVRAGKIIGELNQLNTRTTAAQLKRFRTVNLLIWLSATSPFFPAVLNVANYIANVNQKERNLLQLIIFFKLLYQLHRKWNMFFHIPKQIFPFDDAKFAQTLGEIRQV